MKEILVYSFMIFFLCSFIGYFLEVFWVFLGTKKIVNRGFLCGPIIPIYGWGAVLILFCLIRYYDDPVVVFVFGTIITSALEYFVSFLLEKIFHNKWWDYSNRRYNINGRICLRNSIAFGVLSLVIIYFVAPLLSILFSLFSFKFWSILSIILFILVLIDTIYSVCIAYNLRNRIIIVEELKNEKLAKIPVLFDKKLKELTSNFKAFPNRLLKAFPDLEREYHNSFEKMKTYREQDKERRKELKKIRKNKRNSE
jgi:uncharacterized membrane protein